VIGEASHSQGGGPSRTAVSVAKEVGAARGTAVEAGATRGAAVSAARGRNPTGTARVERGATSGSNPEGKFGAG
jgi:hypothetical protein